MKKERAVFSAFIFDCLLLVPYLWVALAVGSLTMLAEVLRGIPLVAVAIVSWVTLRKIHRDQTGAYDFGMGKVEQILSVCAAILLCAAIAFVWYKAFSRTGPFPHEITTLNVLAVGLAFANLCANSAPLLPLYRAAKTGNSVVVNTQLHVKFAKTINSAVVTVCVALNQLSSDPALALWADRIGIMIVSVVTIHVVYELLKSSIPDLLDRTLPEHHQIKINQVLAKYFHDFETLKWCQSRQSGSDIEVHMGLGFSENESFGNVARISRSIVEDIESAIPGSHATVTPVLTD